MKQVQSDVPLFLPGIAGGLWDHVPDGGEDPLEDLDHCGDHEQQDNGAQAPRDQTLGVHAEAARVPHPAQARMNPFLHGPPCSARN
jgi:hypothetical protein